MKNYQVAYILKGDTYKVIVKAESPEEAIILVNASVAEQIPEGQKLICAVNEVNE